MLYKFLLFLVRSLIFLGSNNKGNLLNDNNDITSLKNYLLLFLYHQDPPKHHPEKPLLEHILRSSFLWPVDSQIEDCLNALQQENSLTANQRNHRTNYALTQQGMAHTEQLITDTNIQKLFTWMAQREAGKQALCTAILIYLLVHNGRVKTQYFAEYIHQAFCLEDTKYLPTMLNALYQQHIVICSRDNEEGHDVFVFCLANEVHQQLLDHFLSTDNPHLQQCAITEWATMLSQKNNTEEIPNIPPALTTTWCTVRQQSFRAILEDDYYFEDCGHLVLDDTRLASEQLLSLAPYLDSLMPTDSTEEENIFLDVPYGQLKPQAILVLAEYIQKQKNPRKIYVLYENQDSHSYSDILHDQRYFADSSIELCLLKENKRRAKSKEHSYAALLRDRTKQVISIGATLEGLAKIHDILKPIKDLDNPHNSSTLPLSGIYRSQATWKKENQQQTAAYLLNHNSHQEIKNPGNIPFRKQTNLLDSSRPRWVYLSEVVLLWNKAYRLIKMTHKDYAQDDTDELFDAIMLFGLRDHYPFLGDSLLHNENCPHFGTFCQELGMTLVDNKMSEWGETKKLNDLQQFCADFWVGEQGRTSGRRHADISPVKVLHAIRNIAVHNPAKPENYECLKQAISVWFSCKNPFSQPDQTSAEQSSHQTLCGLNALTDKRQMNSNWIDEQEWFAKKLMDELINLLFRKLQEFWLRYQPSALHNDDLYGRHKQNMDYTLDKLEKKLGLTPSSRPDRRTREENSRSTA